MRRRQRQIAGLVGAAVVLAVGIGLVVSAITTDKSGSPVSKTAAPTTEAPTTEVSPAVPSGASTTAELKADRAPNSLGIAGLLSWNTTGWPGEGTESAGALEHDHVDGPVRYSVVPPVGGPHSKTWMNSGVYLKPVPSERAVHNLEHGAVWITYSPTLSPSSIATLTDFVTHQKMITMSPNDPGAAFRANRYIDLSPWANDQLPSPIVISSWGYQLRVSSPTDLRLQAFVDLFRASAKYSPEAGAPVDGLPVALGGEPHIAGSAVSTSTKAPTLAPTNAATNATTNASK